MSRRKMTGAPISQALVEEVQNKTSSSNQMTSKGSGSSDTNKEGISKSPSKVSVSSQPSGLSCDVMSNVVKRKKKHYLLQPLIAYAIFAFQSGTFNNIKLAIMGHISEQQIVEAKDFCRTATLGEKIKIKSTASRSEMEAHTIDILNAITKLDKSDKLSLTVINASSLGVISRSHPEELNDISLCDRLNQVESRMEKMQVLLDKSLAQYMTLQDKLGSMTSYAGMVNKTSANVFNHTQNTTTATMGAVKQPM